MKSQGLWSLGNAFVEKCPLALTPYKHRREVTIFEVLMCAF